METYELGNTGWAINSIGQIVCVAPPWRGTDLVWCAESQRLLAGLSQGLCLQEREEDENDGQTKVEIYQCLGCIYLCEHPRLGYLFECYKKKLWNRIEENDPCWEYEGRIRNDG